MLQPLQEGYGISGDIFRIGDVLGACHLPVDLLQQGSQPYPPGEKTVPRVGNPAIGRVILHNAEDDPCLIRGREEASGGILQLYGRLRYHVLDGDDARHQKRPSLPGLDEVYEVIPQVDDPPAVGEHDGNLRQGQGIVGRIMSSADLLGQLPEKVRTQGNDSDLVHGRATTAGSSI